MLNKYLKGWQDHVFYNRHLLQTNMAAIQFGNQNTKYLLTNVFNVLRQHREQSKFALIYHAVQNDMNVAIADHQAFVAEKSTHLTTRNNKKFGNMIRDALGSKLFSYFQKWRDVNENHKNTMNKRVKSKIIHMYNNYMNSYFDHWKKNSHEKVRRHRAALNQEMMLSNEKLHEEALEGEKNLRIHAEAVRTTKRRTVDKTFRKLFQRRQSVAICRWRDMCGLKQEQEDRAALVIKRMRNRLVRQAFERYTEFYREHQQHGKNLNSLEHIRETLNKRCMRKHFNSMVFYTQRHLRAKRYWNKILGKMDKFMKSRAVKRWAENAHFTHAQNLFNRQNLHTQEIRDRTEEAGKHHLIELEQIAQLKQIDNQRIKKAHRQIGNYFLRSYSSQTGAMFTRWKQNIRDQVHKEKVLRSTLAHWRKNQLEAVGRVFHKFLSDDRARDHAAKIKQTAIEAEEIRLGTLHGQGRQEAARSAHRDTTAAHNETKGELERKIQHTMQCMERRNQNFIMVSRKRMLFTSWRRAAKQQKAFLYCVKNVLEKSMYKKGFVYISGSAKDIHYKENVTRALKKFTFRFFHVNCSDSFTKWKHYGLSRVEQQKQATQSELHARNKEFDEYLVKVSEVNAARCFKFFLGGRTSDVWRAWANVIRQLKLTKSKGVEFATRQALFRRKNAIRRWQGRLLATKSCRHRQGILVRKFQLKYHKAAFLSWKAVFLSIKRLARALSNFESKSRQRDCETTLKCLRAYASTKGAVFEQRRRKGTEDIVSLVTQAYLKRLAAEFHRYKNTCGVSGRKDSRLKTVFGKFHSERVRDAFLWWKRKSELDELSQDLHETGPVRADYWRSMRQIENMKEFLRNEKYTESEIEMLYEGVCDRNEGLMRKYLTRLRLNQEPKKRVLPIVWQRWREYVGIRKLLKYQLNRCQNAIEPGKADMQRAFKKWRSGPEHLTTELWRLPIETIVQLAIRTTKDLDECGDQIAENSAIQNHLMMQRDEFLNYYIKGQILAMGYLKDRNKFVKMQSCSRWLWARRMMTKVDFERQIRDAAYLHANLGQQEASLTTENARLGSENKELHQFGQDGSVIRKNMERLKAETDKIKSRITDTDEDYRELMDKNTALKKQVEEAEAKVAAQGHNRGAFQKLPTLKGESHAEGEVKVGEARKEEPETSAEKKQRERFERLTKLHQGAGLR